MIRRRVINIEKGLACDRDYMRLAHFEPLVVLESERKALRRPTVNSLPKLTTCRADGNFRTNSSCFLAFGVVEVVCNVTIVFNFLINVSARECLTFMFIIAPF